MVGYYTNIATIIATIYIQIAIITNMKTLVLSTFEQNTVKNKTFLETIP